MNPDNQVLAAQFQTTAMPWVNGTVMPVGEEDVRPQTRVLLFAGYAASDVEVPEARETVWRGLCRAGGASH